MEKRSVIVSIVVLPANGGRHVTKSRAMSDHPGVGSSVNNLGGGELKVRKSQKSLGFVEKVSDVVIVYIVCTWYLLSFWVCRSGSRLARLRK